MGTVDEFGRFVVAIVQKQQLIQGLFDFMDLAKENNIDIKCEILFLGEYQRLLFESVILDISYILLDKVEDSKSRMQIEISKVEDKLQNDIDKGIADVNYTVMQKEQTFSQLKNIKDSKDYRKAIEAITTARDKYVAHKDPDFSGKGVLYNQLLLAVKNIKRCYEIRQLVISNVGEVRINSSASYNHQNIIEALILQQEIKALRKSGNYDKNLLETQNRFYSDNLDFWNTEIKPRMVVRGDNNE